MLDELLDEKPVSGPCNPDSLVGIQYTSNQGTSEYFSVLIWPFPYYEVSSHDYKASSQHRGKSV